MSKQTTELQTTAMSSTTNVATPKRSGKQLSTEQRATIVGMKLGGAKARQIADLLELPLSTVYTVLSTCEARKSAAPQNRSGRPKALQPRDSRSLVRILKKDRRASLNDITNQSPAKVHCNTVRKALHDEGFHSRVAVKKPFLTAAHRRKRLDFAKKHKDWTVEDWNRVLWTDESTFEIGLNSRVVLVWRTAEEKYSGTCLTPSFKSGRTSVMIWGGFAHKKKSKLVIMPPRRRTAADFVELVYDAALLDILGEVSGGILMEDGAPVHRSNAPKEWRALRLIEKLNWPANSPDLNPIENVWKLMKDALQRRPTIPRNVEEMQKALLEEWERIDEEKLAALVARMPERIAAVLKAKGGSTRW